MVCLRQISHRETEWLKAAGCVPSGHLYPFGISPVGMTAGRLTFKIKYMYYVYALLLKNNDLYIGYTDDLKKRLYFHQQGKSKFTKPHRPVKLVYYEAYLAKEDATKREYYLKTSQQRELLKERLKNSLLI